MSDTLTALQTALKPKTGMRPIPFPTESYQHPSKPYNAKRLLNYAAEAGPPDSRSPFVLVPTPGLVLSMRVGSGPFYALDTQFVAGFYAVSGDMAYRNIGGVTTAIGTVGLAGNPFPPSTVQTMVTIASNTKYAVICVPPRLYYCLHTDAALTQIDTTPFAAGGVGSVSYLDGYWVVTQYNGGPVINVSGLNDPSAWDPLDFAQIDSMVKILLRTVRHNGELWLLGENGALVWYDAGAADFPLRPMPGSTIPYGVIARTVAEIDGSLWWATRDNTVLRTDGYKAVRVSTHAIETVIKGADVEQCFSVAYLSDGHSYYCLTLPDIGRTLCYDAATRKWHDRSSGADGTGPWRPLQMGRLADTVYAGDVSGWLYSLDDGPTDNGVPIFRQATLPPIFADGHRTFCARAEVEMEVGTSTDASVTLDWSDDGGNNFTGGPRAMSSGAPGAFRKRVYTTRLGSFRERMFRITTRGRTTLYGVEADISAPAGLSGANS
jgi:hypothetical protein